MPRMILSGSRQQFAKRAIMAQRFIFSAIFLSHLYNQGVKFVVNADFLWQVSLDLMLQFFVRYVRLDHPVPGKDPSCVTVRDECPFAERI